LIIPFGGDTIISKLKKRRIQLRKLLRILRALGVNVDDIETKNGAIRRLSEYYREHGLDECECPSCENRIPDVQRCPFCGVAFEDNERDPDKLQVRRGVRKYNEITENGHSLFVAVARRIRIPIENVALGGDNRLSLWSEYGVFATARKGKYSLRFMLPYKADKYGGYSKKITNLRRPVGKYKSRFSIGDKSEAGDAAAILLITLKMFTLEGKG
jgi:hypothetical protein